MPTPLEWRIGKAAVYSRKGRALTTMPRYTLTLATSADAFIARSPSEPPQAWASPEEQALFFRDVEAADWSIMGRHTHEAADRPDRRRIVFSSTVAGWQRPTQLWIDPWGITPADLPALVEDVHPMRTGLILGGVRVHDWFLEHGAIDRVNLTVEPLRFGKGLPVFSGQTSRDPVAIFEALEFEVISDEILNASGTRYLELVRRET